METEWLTKRHRTLMISLLFALNNSAELRAGTAQIC